MLRQGIDLPCPSCRYAVWVILVEVVAGISVICPVCRVRIRLVDQSGSVQVISSQIEHALDDIFK